MYYLHSLVYINTAKKILETLKRRIVILLKMREVESFLPSYSILGGSQDTTVLQAVIARLGDSKENENNIGVCNS